MANTKITALTADATPASNDLLVTVDVSDTTMDAAGTDKKATINNMAGTMGPLITSLGTVGSATSITSTAFVGPLTGDVTGTVSGNAGTVTNGVYTTDFPLNQDTTGNAATVTNATLTTALTVDTGTVGLTGNVANNSVLTLGAGASSVSGANTGDQTLTGLDYEVTGTSATHAAQTTGVHGVGAGTIAEVADIATDANLSAAAQAVVTAGACDVDANLSAAAQAVISNTSNTNTGDTTSGISDTNRVVIDGVDITNGEYAKFTASGLQSKTFAEVKTDLSLNNVENTAISTATAIGTISTGVWEATDIGVAHGGTGASTAQAAIDTLSAVSAATNEYVLTKDTATGNAKWKASAAGTSLAGLSDTTITVAAKGDVLVYNGSAWVDLTVGANGTVLTAASGEATGLSWAAAGAGDALVANPLSQFAATTSLQLKGVISDETGSGGLVFADTPTLVSPILGTPTSGNLANCTFPTLNQNTTGTAATVTGATQASITTVANVVTVGALNSGSITSGFGNINNGASTITTTGLITGGGFTSTGNITLGENEIVLDGALSADEKFSGTSYSGTIGYSATQGDLVYLAVADGRWEAADADAVATAGDVMLGIVMEASKVDGNACMILLQGMARSAAFGALASSGDAVYVSTTAGNISQTAPSATGDVVRVIGHCLDSATDTIYFNPSADWVEVA